MVHREMTSKLQQIFDSQASILYVHLTMLLDDCVEHHKVLPPPNTGDLKTKQPRGERSICCST